MKNYELIEHTADIGIRLKSRDLEGLFKNSALAMFDIIAKRKLSAFSCQLSAKKVIVKQKADNLEELLVNWLNELLSLSAVKEVIFFDFQINRLDKNNLGAVAIGSNIKGYKVNVEIKAATYHEVEIKSNNGIWQAEVIFDV